MPTRPPKACAHPGCPALVAKGKYCAEHQPPKRRAPDRRASAARRGYGSRWRRYREHYLRDNPLCVECLKHGRYKPATDVDHINAVVGPYDPLFWEPSNHQALCHECHSAKTAKEDGGLGRTKKQREGPEQGGNDIAPVVV